MLTARDAGLFVAAVSFFAACLSGCGENSPAAPPSGASMVKYVAGDSCLRDTGKEESERATGPDAKVEVTVDGLLIDVIHRNAVLNCCPDSILVDFNQDGWRLVLEETDVLTHPCRCNCEYEVSATIEVTRPGTYTLEIWTKDALVWTCQAEVEGTRP